MRSAIVVASLLVSSAAFAQPAEPRVWLLDLTVQTEIGLHRGDAGDPVSVAPDLSILTRGFPQVEIVHSSSAITGFHGLIPGTSFCVHGDTCDLYDASVYHNAGLQFAYTVRSHAPDDPDDSINHFAFSVSAGLLANNFDPFTLAAKLGVRGSYVTSDFVQLQLLPSVQLALTEQEGAATHRLFVPLTLTVIPTEKVTLQLETGIAAPFDGFEENVQVPVGVNLDLSNGSGTSVLASFTLPAALAGDAIGLDGLDARVLTVGIRWSKFLGGQAE